MCQSVHLGCIQIMFTIQCYKAGVRRVIVFFLCVILNSLGSAIVAYVVCYDE